ncbi:MAG: flagellar basal body rod protein FlgC, partial [Limisphaerales bacterium]
MVQILSGIQNSTAALEAERTRLDVISENIANVNTTRGPDGKPYQRQVVVFESALQQAMGSDNASQTPTLR